MEEVPPDPEPTTSRCLVGTLLAIVCLAIGAYPVLYWLAEGKPGLLQTKSDTLLANPWWRLGFYAHITAGGVALGIGWAQFIRSWRQRHPGLHRILGKVYVAMVCVSGVAGVCIAFHATTGGVAGLGFGSLGILWVCFTLLAYTSIRKRDLRRHEHMMIYSYSASFAAVTLRLWLPLLLGVFRLEFAVAYPIVAWLCWVPNLLVARWIVSRT